MPVATVQRRRQQNRTAGHRVAQVGKIPGKPTAPRRARGGGGALPHVSNPTGHSAHGHVRLGTKVVVHHLSGRATGCSWHSPWLRVAKGIVNLHGQRSTATCLAVRAQMPAACCQFVTSFSGGGQRRLQLGYRTRVVSMQKTGGEGSQPLPQRVSRKLQAVSHMQVADDGRCLPTKETAQTAATASRLQTILRARIRVRCCYMHCDHLGDDHCILPCVPSSTNAKSCCVCTRAKTAWRTGRGLWLDQWSEPFASPGFAPQSKPRAPTSGLRSAVSDAMATPIAIVGCTQEHNCTRSSDGIGDRAAGGSCLGVGKGAEARAVAK